MRENGKKQGRGLFDFVRNKGKLWLLVGGVIVGVFLLLVGSGIGEQESADTDTRENTTYEDAADLAAYEKALEDELEALCESVAGVGQTEVMVTLGSGCRVVYVTDEDGRVESIGTGSSQKPVYRTLQPPTVVGVGVVCKGGDNAHIQKTLTDLISTTLGITSNRVCITGK